MFIPCFSNLFIYYLNKKLDNSALSRPPLFKLCQDYCQGSNTKLTNGLMKLDVHKKIDLD